MVAKEERGEAPMGAGKGYGVGKWELREEGSRLEWRNGEALPCGSSQLPAWTVAPGSPGTSSSLPKLGLCAQFISHSANIGCVPASAKL